MSAGIGSTVSYLESLPHGVQLLLPLVHIALLVRVGWPHSEHKARNKKRSGQDDLTEHKARNKKRSGQDDLTEHKARNKKRSGQDTEHKGRDNNRSGQDDLILNTTQETTTDQDRMTSLWTQGKKRAGWPHWTQGKRQQQVRTGRLHWTQGKRQKVRSGWPHSKNTRQETIDQDRIT